MSKVGFGRDAEFNQQAGTIPTAELAAIRKRAQRRTGHTAQRTQERLTKERVSRVIALIGEKAIIVVRQEDKRLGVRQKFASAHDLRRGCAQRLINSGVSAETLKVIMRHADFATTEKHYGAMRSAQAAAGEVRQKLPNATSEALVGRFVGRSEAVPTISPEELQALKSLLERL